MRTKIITIGNSQGIRLPRTLLEESGIAGEVEVTVENSSLVIRAAHKPRTGWEAAFAKMAEFRDDVLLDGDASPLTSWDEREWQWK